MKNPVLVFFDSAYGYATSATREAGRDLTEKELRKWWRHYSDNTPEYISVAAVYEDEDGHAVDATEYWCMHECSKYAEAHYHVFN